LILDERLRALFFWVLKIPVHFFCRWCLPVVLTAQLYGCAQTSAPLTEILAAVASEKFGTASAAPFATHKPNPAYNYLRVELEGHAPALLVLGYVDPHPQGDIEVWYSAQQEVIKTQNGRIVGTAGLEVDWRTVQFPSSPPAWPARDSQGATYQRRRDEMPGHHYGITEQVMLQPWQGMPPIHLPISLSEGQARTYVWFRESTLKTTAESLPPAWFAWGVRNGISTVVYSEQCLSSNFCLKLQRWPVQEGAL